MTMMEFILRKDAHFTDEEREKCLPTISRLIALANSARKEGVLALDAVAKGEKNLFLKAGLELIVDGRDPEMVKSVLQHLLLAESHSGADLLDRLLIAEGILSVQMGENPLSITYKLGAMLGERFLQQALESAAPKKATSAPPKKEKAALPECTGFEDRLSRLGGSMARLLEKTDKNILETALHGCSSTFTYQRLRTIVSESHFMSIIADMTAMGQVPREQVLTAQAQMLATLDEMVEQGLIVEK
jgi:hypothetical protein